MPSFPIGDSALKALLEEGVCALIIENGPCSQMEVGEKMSVHHPPVKGQCYDVRVMSKQKHGDEVILVVMNLPKKQTATS